RDLPCLSLLENLYKLDAVSGGFGLGRPGKIDQQPQGNAEYAQVVLYLRALLVTDALNRLELDHYSVHPVADNEVGFALADVESLVENRDDALGLVRDPP